MPYKIPVYLLKTNEISGEFWLDKDDYNRLKNYRYFVDKNNPYNPKRESKRQKVDGKYRPQLFYLRRDIMEVKSGDTLVVKLKNPAKPYDLRKDNLDLQERPNGGKKVLSKHGYTWPYTFPSFKSFFRARGENKVCDLLDIIENYKYKNKNISLIFRHDEDIDLREIKIFLQRNILKYFDAWTGEVEVCKAGLNKKLQEEYSKKEKSREVPTEETFVDEEHDEVVEEVEDKKYADMEKQLQELTLKLERQKISEKEKREEKKPRQQEVSIWREKAVQNKETLHDMFEDYTRIVNTKNAQDFIYEKILCNSEAVPLELLIKAIKQRGAGKVIF